MQPLLRRTCLPLQAGRARGSGRVRESPRPPATVTHTEEETLLHLCSGGPAAVSRSGGGLGLACCHGTYDPGAVLSGSCTSAARPGSFPWVFASWLERPAGREGDPACRAQCGGPSDRSRRRRATWLWTGHRRAQTAGTLTRTGRS